MPRDLLAGSGGNKQKKPRDLLAPPQRGNALDAVDAFTDRAANAALFNFGDELSAGLGAATIGTIGGGINAIKRGSLAEIPKAQRQTFQEFRDIHRDKRAEQQKLAPRAALAGDIVGGVVGGGKATAAAQKAFGGAVNTARGAGLVGAGEGAVFATGGAEGNLLERADDAAVGGIIGGLGGFGIQKVANGLRSFFTNGRKQLTAPKELREGIRIVQKRLAADLGGDDKARAFLKDWAGAWRRRSGACPLHGGNQWSERVVSACSWRFATRQGVSVCRRFQGRFEAGNEKSGPIDRRPEDGRCDG